MIDAVFSRVELFLVKNPFLNLITDNIAPFPRELDT